MRYLERHAKWVGIPLIVAMAILAFSLAIVKPASLAQFELKSLDFRFLARGTITPNPSVGIIAVDDDALSEVGRWPWSRDKIAKIIDKSVNKYGAKAVGFDMVFSEDQDNIIDEAVRLLKESGANDSSAHNLEWLKSQHEIGDVDAVLEGVLRKNKDKLVPGYFFYARDAGAPDLVKSKLAEEADLMRSLAMTASFSKEAMESIPHIIAIEGNIPRVTKAVDSIGFFNFFPDPDGTVRRIPLMAEMDGFVYPSMAMQTLRVFLDWPDMSVVVDETGVEEVRVGVHKVQTDVSGGMLLNHYGPGKTFPHYSAADILNDRLQGDELRGKVVVFGVTAVAVLDIRATPFDPVFPGVEAHAVAISNILNDEALRRPVSVEVIELLLVFVLSLMAGYLVLGRPPVVQGLVIVVFPILILMTSQWLFNKYHLWIEETFLIVGVLLTTVPTALLGYIIESRKRAFIHDAFAHYLSPQVVENLSKNPDSLKLGGEEKYMTAFFSDIAAFSTFSEKLAPTELVSFLNRYLTAMSDIILNEQGTVDKYEGDAIIAFFGAPLDMQDHALRCVKAALRQQALLAELREKWVAEGLPAVHIRIGLNSGPMVVGNMGTNTSMNYTMMGDHVNLAARLEGVCKAYRVPILMSKDTYNEVRTDIAARFVDRVRVVGRTQPVDLYQPLGERAHLDAEDLQEARAYEKAWQTMFRGDYREALKLMKSLAKISPHDGLYEVMIARLNSYLVNPPAHDWSGVFNLQSK